MKRRLWIIILLTLIIALCHSQCGGSVCNSCGTSSNPSGVTGNTESGDSSSSGDGSEPTDSSEGSPFGDTEQTQSFLMARNIFSTFDTFDSNFLVKIEDFEGSFLVSYATSLCQAGGNVNITSKNFDYSDCSLSENGYNYTQNGDLNLTAQGLSGYLIGYDYDMTVSGGDISAFTYSISGDVDVSIASRSKTYDLELDITAGGNDFSFLGQLVQDDDGLYTGNLTVIYNTIIHTCEFDDFDASNQTSYLGSCSF